jgi:small subunit ribosomal protein S13
MLRLAGVDLPEQKRIEVALTYIYGVGPKTSRQILEAAKIDGNTRANTLSATEVAKLQKVLDNHKIEGNLRKEIRDNVTRLKRIHSYRGFRHMAGLPTRGQRTRVNARTRRGKRKTIGAMKKDDMAKMTG